MTKEDYRVKIRDEELNPTDIEAAKAFLREHGTLNKLAEGSKVKYHCALWAFLKELKVQGKALETLDKEAVIGLAAYLEKTAWSEDTREDYWKRWLKFCEWAEETKGLAWSADTKKLLLDSKKRFRYKKDKNKITKKGIFTPEEALQLVQAESNTAWQTFWAVLYESGMRSGEAFALRLENVKTLPGKGYVLELPKSKTVKRTIPIVHFSRNYLSRWLQLHPQKDNPNAMLFVNTLGEPIENKAANKRLNLLVKATGLGRKKVSLHSFRHSRATELCHIMTEAQMCSFFGWSMGSSMPRTYIRSEAVDVTGALLRGYGMEEKEHHEIKGRTCMNCQQLNTFNAEYCDVCKLPLDPQKLQTVRDATNAEALMEKMAKQLHGKLIDEVSKMIKQGA